MSKIWMSRGGSRFLPTCGNLLTPFDVLFVCRKVRNKAAVSNKQFIPDTRGHMSACVQIHVVFAFALVLISFDVCQYLPSLDVSGTTVKNGSQMHRKHRSKHKR